MTSAIPAVPSGLPDDLYHSAPLDGEGSAADFSHFGFVGHSVEELPDGAAHNLDGKKEDEEANQQAADMIGSGEANGIGKGKANRDQD